MASHGSNTTQTLFEKITDPIAEYIADNPGKATLITAVVPPLMLVFYVVTTDVKNDITFSQPSSTTEQQSFLKRAP